MSPFRSLRPRRLPVLIATVSALALAPLVGAQGGPPPKTVTGDAADVPMRLRGPEPAVDVTIGGRPFLFAIDTGGAGDARADTSLVSALNLETIGQARGSSGGAVQVMPIVLVPDLTLGGITWRNLPAPSRDYNATGLPHIDGIFGLQAFSDFLLTLDFPRARVRIAHGDLPPADGASVINADFSRRVPTIPIDVAGHALQAVVDTGNVSPETLMLPAALAADLPLVAPPVTSGAVTSVSGRASSSTAELAGTLTAGGITIAHPRVLFVDGIATANLGDAFLHDAVLTLDQKNKRLRIERGTR